MLPFTDAFVPTVDVAGGRLVVAPPGAVDAKQRGEE
jgi:ribosomal 30S subunit maturation factor RimM